jgi:hypothetical protein
MASSTRGFWRLLCALAALQQRRGAHLDAMKTLGAALRHAIRTDDDHGIRIVGVVRRRLRHPIDLPPILERRAAS